MKAIEFASKGLLAASVIAAVGMAIPAHATLDPLPVLCFNDNNGSPTVSYTYLSEITDPPVSTPNITTGVESITVQFYAGEVFFPHLGTFAVILTGAGNTPQEILTMNVTQLSGLDSVTFYFADSTASGFSTLVSEAESSSSPQLALTGTQQDLTTLLDLPLDDSVDVCINCTATVPDSTPTWSLLALSLGGLTALSVFVNRMRKTRSEVV